MRDAFVLYVHDMLFLFLDTAISLLGAPRIRQVPVIFGHILLTPLGHVAVEFALGLELFELIDLGELLDRGCVNEEYEITEECGV